jgi:hypothetical protein
MKSKRVYRVKAKVLPPSISKNIRSPKVAFYPYYLVTLPTNMFEYSDGDSRCLIGDLSEFATIEIGLN